MKTLTEIEKECKFDLYWNRVEKHGSMECLNSKEKQEYIDLCDYFSPKYNGPDERYEYTS